MAPEEALGEILQVGFSPWSFLKCVPLKRIAVDKFPSISFLFGERFTPIIFYSL